MFTISSFTPYNTSRAVAVRRRLRPHPVTVPKRRTPSILQVSRYYFITYQALNYETLQTELLNHFGNRQTISLQKISPSKHFVTKPDDHVSPACQATQAYVLKMRRHPLCEKGVLSEGIWHYSSVKITSSIPNRRDSAKINGGATGRRLWRSHRWWCKSHLQSFHLAITYKIQSTLHAHSELPIYSQNTPYFDWFNHTKRRNNKTKPTPARTTKKYIAHSKSMALKNKNDLVIFSSIHQTSPGPT